MPQLFVAILALFALPVLAEEQDQDKWEKTRNLAMSQHEVVMLLIESKEYEKVPAAADKIFKLHFPEEQEHRVVKEVELILDALLVDNQYSIAHEVLDMAMACVKKVASRARLHREKAYLYRKEGKKQKAIESFEKAFQLEKGASP